MLRTGNKSDLLSSLDDRQDTSQYKPSVECIVIDGPAVVNVLTPVNCTTLKDYSKKVLLSFILQQFQQVVGELTLFGMFIWKKALNNLQELKEVKVFVAVYCKTRQFQATGMHFFVLITTKLNYLNFSQLKLVNFKLTNW